MSRSISSKLCLHSDGKTPAFTLLRSPSANEGLTSLRFPSTRPDLSRDCTANQLPAAEDLAVVEASCAPPGTASHILAIASKLR